MLQGKRLDLDAAKSRLKKAKTVESSAVVSSGRLATEVIFIQLIAKSNLR